jgi:hypothetical protein
VQLGQTADSINRANRLLIAGIALAGAALIVVNPAAPTLPNLQYRAVQLTAGEQDWTQVLSTTEENLTNLESQAATANSGLSSAVGTELSGFETQISNAFTGVESGLQNSISGGWYGSDDGYVFGSVPGFRVGSGRHRDRQHAAGDFDRPRTGQRPQRWPTQLATALGESTAASASSLSADLLPDLLSSL